MNDDDFVRIYVSNVFNNESWVLVKFRFNLILFFGGESVEEDKIDFWNSEDGLEIVGGWDWVVVEVLDFGFEFFGIFLDGF